MILLIFQWRGPAAFQICCDLELVRLHEDVHAAYQSWRPPAGSQGHLSRWLYCGPCCRIQGIWSCGGPAFFSAGAPFFNSGESSPGQWLLWPDSHSDTEVLPQSRRETSSCTLKLHARHFWSEISQHSSQNNCLVSDEAQKVWHQHLNLGAP